MADERKPLGTDEDRIVRALGQVILNEQVNHSRRALCDVLGVLVAHVIDGAPAGTDRGELLAAGLDLIQDDVLTSYHNFLDWKKRQLS